MPVHLSASLTNLPGDYDLHLLSPDNALVAESTNEGLADESIELDLSAPGDYRLYVTSPHGDASSDQTFTLSVSSAGGNVPGAL